MFSEAYLNSLKNYKSDTGSRAKLINAPQEEFVVAKEKYYDIIIVPWRAAANHPLVVTKVIAEGEWVTSLDIWTHRNIGPEKVDCICPKTYGHKCPICELQYEIFKSSGKEAAAGLRHSKRSYFNISETDQRCSSFGKLKMFNISAALFTEKLLESAVAETRGMGVVPFAATDNTGTIVSFHTYEDSFGANKYVDFGSFKFLPRPALPEAMVMDAIAYERFMQVPSYDELRELLGDAGNSGFQPPPASTLAGGYTAGYNPANYAGTIPASAPAPAYGAPAPAAGSYQPASTPVAAATSYAPATSTGAGYAPGPGNTPTNPPAAAAYTQQPVSTPAAGVSGQPVYGQPAVPDVGYQQVNNAAPQPAPTNLICPAGLQFGRDVETSRSCNFCEVYDGCKKAKLGQQ